MPIRTFGNSRNEGDSEPAKIEVTPEMVEAGSFVLSKFDCDFTDLNPQKMVAAMLDAIFVSMSLVGQGSDVNLGVQIGLSRDLAQEAMQPNRAPGVGCEK